MNLAETLRESARRLPEKTALSSTTSEMTYAELDNEVDRVAHGLVSAGIGSGDAVVVIGRTNAAFARNLYAVLRMGAIAVPTNPELTATELDHVLSDCGARAVLTRSAPEAVAGAMDRHSELNHVFTEDGHGGNASVADFSADSDNGITGDDQPIALLQYTSGTTGRPKGAILTHDNILANQRQMDGTRIAVAESDRVLGVLPMYHIYGLGVALAYPLARGAEVYLVERFRADETLREMCDRRISVVPAAPPIFMAWVAAATGDTYDLACVRAAVSGASALQVETWLAFHERFNVEIWQGYGLTETSPVVSSTAMLVDAAPGSIGQPLPGVEVRLVDETGQPVREGDPGEILVRGDNVFSGYWGDDAAGAAVVDADGWLHTGDVAYSEDDVLYLVDRKTDLIIVSGFNVYPKEVEQALASHADVAEAAVVGRADERSGERVVAYIVPREGLDIDGLDADAVEEHAHEHLARYKWPAGIHVVASLPHLLTGKVSRRTLREWDLT